MFWDLFFCFLSKKTVLCILFFAFYTQNKFYSIFDCIFWLFSWFLIFACFSIFWVLCKWFWMCFWLFLFFRNFFFASFQLLTVLVLSFNFVLVSFVFFPIALVFLSENSVFCFCCFCERVLFSKKNILVSFFVFQVFAKLFFSY